VGVAAAATTGAIAGRVAGNPDGAPLGLATIVVSSPALDGEQTGYTDETGGYLVVELPPGEYDVHAIYGEAEATRARVPVRAGEVTIVNPSIDVGRAPLGRQLDEGALRNIPWPGRTSTTLWGDQPRGPRRDP
jgi:hypothetical protein